MHTTTCSRVNTTIISIYTSIRGIITTHISVNNTGVTSILGVNTNTYGTCVTTCSCINSDNTKITTSSGVTSACNTIISVNSDRVTVTKIMKIMKNRVLHAKL